MPLKKWIAKGFIAIILAVGGACLEASSDLIKNNFEPVLVSARNFLEDRLFPIPSSALIGINLTFYLPSADAGEASAEGLSATIPGSLCLASNGHNIVRPFEESANGYRNKTNVIMHICSGLHLKSTRPAFTAHFQPTLAATSDGPGPTIPANEPAFISINLHSISPDPQ